MRMLDDTARARMRAAVLTELNATSEHPAVGRRQLRKPGILIAASAMLVGVGVTSAAAEVIHHRSIGAPPVASARCYGAVSNDRSDNFPGFTVVIGNPGLNVASAAAKIIDPVPLCANLWQIGALPRTGNSQTINQTAHARVPSLTACVGADGRVSVFPGTTATCAAEGLSIDTNSRPHVAG